MSRTENDNNTQATKDKSGQTLRTIVDDELTRAGSGGPWVW